MKASKKLQILAICRATRNWAYRRIRAGTMIARWPTLELACGICAIELMKRLHRVNIKAKYVENRKHAFVLVGKYIVDVTAGQFIGCRVDQLITIKKQKDKRRYQTFWQPTTVTASISKAIKLQAQWPDGQRHPDFLKLTST